MTETLEDQRIYAAGIVTEEAAEVIQAISKINRFGLFSVFNGNTNKELLEGEIGDLIAGISILGQLGVINFESVESAMHDKFLRLNNWSIDLDGAIERAELYNILNYDRDSSGFSMKGAC